MYPMTRYVIVALLIFVPGACIYAQQRTADAAIEEIRAAFKEINSKNLTKEHYTYTGDGCAEDGVVDYFLDKQQIVKIKESGSMGDGSWATEYYYRNGDLIFIYETQIGGPAIGKVEKSEYRVYVKDGRVIRFMQNQQIIPADNKAAEMTSTAIKILKARTTKNFAAALCGD
ncbi:MULTISPECIES: hypothetical protein [Niastella]|uniref:SnoaL-like domain-containing protein n=1 Tax=Niastella soli TaxID=2821487 RepID=A0ABS3YX04_9BACT|nr:hypothetical protein [Niastella soli]MBO9202447.1 hypothetical protein [Niastella soli]